MRGPTVYPWHVDCCLPGVADANVLVDALHTDPAAARWPYLDRLIELRDAGLVAPEVWRLVCALTDEYEAELAAWRRRTLS